jgi:hypothetical protein
MDLGNIGFEDLEQCQNPLDFYVRPNQKSVATILSIIVKDNIG